jgi:hypothetical protein
MFNLFDTVRVVEAGGRLVKEGVIVQLTTVGARVYQAKCDPPLTDDPKYPEWFPFNSKELKMILVKSKHRPKK